MEETSSRKCENCGGALQAVDADALKCPYCGCTYSLKKTEQPRTAAGVTASAPQASNTTESKSSGARIFLILFFLVFVVIVLAVIINNARVASVASSSSTDSLKGDAGNASLKILSDDDIKEAHEPHIKKTNPEPEVMITKHWVGMDEGDKVIMIGYRNKGTHEFERVDFTMQLFDGQGRELTVPDSEKTKQLFKRTDPGESDSNEWMLENGLTKAKTAKITLKKVVLDSVVWDY